MKTKEQKNESLYWVGELSRTSGNILKNPGSFTEEELKLANEIDQKVQELRNMVRK